MFQQTGLFTAEHPAHQYLSHNGRLVVDEFQSRLTPLKSLFVLKGTGYGGMMLIENEKYSEVKFN